MTSVKKKLAYENKRSFRNYLDCFSMIQVLKAMFLKSSQSVKVREGYVKRNVKQIFTSLMWFLAGF